MEIGFACLNDFMDREVDWKKNDFLSIGHMKFALEVLMAQWFEGWNGKNGFCVFVYGIYHRVEYL